MKCGICGHPSPQRFLSLGDQPPSDAFLKPHQLKEPEQTYPLELEFCPTCYLVQLTYAVDPDKMFRDYVYASGTNARLIESFRDLVNSIVRDYSLTKDDFVIDIGSNDGTLLKNYEPYGIKILGVDPSSVAAEAARKGVPTVVDYFNESTAHSIREEHGPSRVITATNVFAHVLELESFMRGIDVLLSPDGIFISESGYLMDIIDNMEYDCVYHEHLRYYSVLSLRELFDRYGMEINSVIRTRGSSGGSIRVFASRKGARPVSPSVEELLSLEKDQGLDTLATFQKFATRVESTKQAMLSLLKDMKLSGMKIIGIGAPAKGNTLLNYCKIGPEFLDYLAETSRLKIGLYSPGMHIPVVEEAQLFKDNPGAALLLSWNYADIIVPKLQKMGYRGKFILPNPSPHVL